MSELPKEFKIIRNKFMKTEKMSKINEKTISADNWNL